MPAWGPAACTGSSWLAFVGPSKQKIGSPGILRPSRLSCRPSGLPNAEASGAFNGRFHLKCLNDLEFCRALLSVARANFAGASRCGPGLAKSNLRGGNAAWSVT
jgi:hypothetical protein